MPHSLRSAVDEGVDRAVALAVHDPLDTVDAQARLDVAFAAGARPGFVVEELERRRRQILVLERVPDRLRR